MWLSLISVVFGLLYCFIMGVILGFAIGVSIRRRDDKELDEYFGRKEVTNRGSNLF